MANGLKEKKKKKKEYTQLGSVNAASCVFSN